MPYVQTLIDNFDGATLDTNKWLTTQGPGTTVSGGLLHQACVADYPRIEGKDYFDLSNGILAAKLSATGTRSPNTEFYIGARNSTGNAISGMGGPAGTYLTFQGSGATTFSNEVKLDTTVGIGPSWVNGTWWGLGNIGADNIIHMYKSTDGQNWTEMAYCTVGGTFDKFNASLVFMAGIWDGTTTDLMANYDDASYWGFQTETFVTRKVMWGGQWVPAVPKARIGGVWIPASPKPRLAGAWDDQI